MDASAISNLASAAAVPPPAVAISAATPTTIPGQAQGQNPALAFAKLIQDAIEKTVPADMPPQPTGSSNKTKNLLRSDSLKSRDSGTQASSQNQNANLPAQNIPL